MSQPNDSGNWWAEPSASPAPQFPPQQHPAQPAASPQFPGPAPYAQPQPFPAPQSPSPQFPPQQFPAPQGMPANATPANYRTPGNPPGSAIAPQPYPQPQPQPRPAPIGGAAPAAGQQDQLLFNIGDIGVSRHWIVTPNGTSQIRGSAWIVRDMTRVETKTPTWAIVLAIIGFLLCLLGLFFLLAKETVTVGYVEVQVQSGRLMHVTQIPVSSPEQVQAIRAQVAQAQAIAAQA